MRAGMSIRISAPLRSLASVENRKASTKFFKQMEFWIRQAGLCVVRGPWSAARRPYSPNNRAAFSLRISGRTSSLMPIFSKSASQRSGVIHG